MDSLSLRERAGVIGLAARAEYPLTLSQRERGKKTTLSAST